MKEILEQISRIRVNCGWEFLFSYDSEFASRYSKETKIYEILHLFANFKTVVKKILFSNWFLRYLTTPRHVLRRYVTRWQLKCFV